MHIAEFNDYILAPCHYFQSCCVCDLRSEELLWLCTITTKAQTFMTLEADDL